MAHYGYARPRSVSDAGEANAQDGSETPSIFSSPLATVFARARQSSASRAGGPQGGRRDDGAPRLHVRLVGGNERKRRASTGASAPQVLREPCSSRTYSCQPGRRAHSPSDRGRG